jgi:exonuclease SbcC
MKPVYLEFCGVNSFSETASIDFRKLLNGGLFGIFGDTGSGKSTILDSIHFALYGKIERASGAGADCINYNCDKATVIFDFEIVLQGERRTFRVQRERRRKNNVAKAALYEYTSEGKLFALAEKTSDVDDKLQEIIGLSFDDFKKCIALPQGEFAGLVHSTNKDRLNLVSRLFDLEKYGDRLGFTIRRKCDEITHETDVLQAKMQENDGGRDEIIAQKTMEIELLKKQKAETESKLLQAEETFANLEKLQERKTAYEKLCAQLKAAQDSYQAYSEKSVRLQRAEQAKILQELAQKAREMRKSEQGAQAAFEAAQKQAENALVQI